MPGPRRDPDAAGLKVPKSRRMAAQDSRLGLFRAKARSLTLYGGVSAAEAHLRLKSEEIGRAGENRPPRIAWTARNGPWP